MAGFAAPHQKTPVFGAFLRFGRQGWIQRPEIAAVIVLTPNPLGPISPFTAAAGLTKSLVLLGFVLLTIISVRKGYADGVICSFFCGFYALGDWIGWSGVLADGFWIGFCGLRSWFVSFWLVWCFGLAGFGMDWLFGVFLFEDA